MRVMKVLCVVALAVSLTVLAVGTSCEGTGLSSGRGDGAPSSVAWPLVGTWTATYNLSGTTGQLRVT